MSNQKKINNMKGGIVILSNYNEIMSHLTKIHEKSKQESLNRADTCFTQPLFTVKDIMRIFGYSRYKAYKLIHSSEFPKMTLGSTYRIVPDSLKKWIQQNYNNGNNL